MTPLLRCRPRDCTLRAVVGIGLGTAARVGSVGDCFEQALAHFGDPDPTRPGKGRRLAGLVQRQRTLFVLNGLEPLQQPPGSPLAGQLLDPDLRDFIQALAQVNPGLLLITSRQTLPDVDGLKTGSRQREFEDLAPATAVRLPREFGVKLTARTRPPDRGPRLPPPPPRTRRRRGRHAQPLSRPWERRTPVRRFRTLVTPLLRCHGSGGAPRRGSARRRSGRGAPGET